MAIANFKALKERVGIDDVAYSLGYRVNRLAGVGRYIEMVLPDGDGRHVDTIVIKNPQDKPNQTYFRHNCTGVGDVVKFVMENINSFNESGRNNWEIAGKVLCKLANEPIPEYADSSYLSKMGYSGEHSFEPERYDTQPIKEHLKNGMMYMQPRGFSKETLRMFAPNIVRIKDTKSERFSDYNIGFPYREPGKDEIVGYEIRGYGNFKGKVSGTNSTTAAWIVNLSDVDNPMAVRNVYFAESAYDIMAFYQANRMKLNTEDSVFVSIGGTFSDRQITGIMNHYSNACAVDCFDNDLAGRVYGIRMAGLLEGKHLNIVKTDDGIRMNIGGKEMLFEPEKATLTEVAKHMKLEKRIRQWKPPREFKDWNDVIMKKPMEQGIITSKFQRDEQLEKRRTSGLKL